MALASVADRRAINKRKKEKKKKRKKNNHYRVWNWCNTNGEGGKKKEWRLGMAQYQANNCSLQRRINIAFHMDKCDHRCMFRVLHDRIELPRYCRACCRNYEN